MDYINIGKSVCNDYLINGNKVVDIFDLWKLFEIWEKEKNVDYENFNFDEAERDVIERALKKSNGNIAKAAKLCGIYRSTFYYKMQRFGISAKPKMGLIKKLVK